MIGSLTKPHGYALSFTTAFLSSENPSRSFRRTGPVLLGSCEVDIVDWPGLILYKTLHYDSWLTKNLAPPMFAPLPLLRVAIFTLGFSSLVAGLGSTCSTPLGAGTSGPNEPFWMETIKHQGKAPFNPNPNGYKVFRNVKVS